MARLRRCGVQDEQTEDISQRGTFEPLLAGDRQKQKRVAKALNPLQKGPVESQFVVSCPGRWLHQGGVCIVCV
jgi:hypothetical protein